MEFSIPVILIATVILMDILSLATPGQDFFTVTRNAMHFGKKAGFMTAFGIASAVTLHSLLAMTGVSLLLSQSPSLLAFIKTLGAIYLIYLGTQFIKNAGTSSQSENQEISNAHSTSLWKSFQMGFICNILNAEAILFVISIFTVIVPPEVSWQLKLIICLVIFLNNIVWWSGVTHLFSVAKVKTFFFHHAKDVERLAGGVLIFLGSRSLLSQK